MKKAIFIITLGLSSCIGVDIVDDFIESNLVITNVIDTLYLGTQHEFFHRFTNSIGEIVEITPDWDVSDNEVISIDASGIVTSKSEDLAWVSIAYMDDQTLVTDTTKFFVSKNPVRIEVTNAINELRVAGTYQLIANFYNVFGEIEVSTFNWESSDASLLSVDQEGNLEARAVGIVDIIVSDEINSASQTISISVLAQSTEEEILIQNEISEITQEETYELSYQYYDVDGTVADTEVTWLSSDENVITVSSTGLLSAITPGQSTISVYKSSDDQIIDSFEIVVLSNIELTTRSGIIETTSSYVLEGNFTFTNIEGGIRIDVSENYKATAALPELVVYITNNPTTINPDVSLEVAPVTVFEGAHSYDVIGEGLDVNTYDYILYYCKPFGVKVGDGKLEN